MWSRSLRNKKKEEGFTSAQQAYDCALDLLSYRDYSHKDMVERLQRKGATKAQALEAQNNYERAVPLAKLEDYGLLNEERYAQRVYEAWLAKRYYGRQHLQLELSKRGIRPDVAAEIMERFTPDIEEQQAENAAQLFVQRNQRKLTAETDNKKIYAAAGRFMAARGFSSRYVHIILGKLHFSDNI